MLARVFVASLDDALPLYQRLADDARVQRFGFRGIGSPAWDRFSCWQAAPSDSRPLRGTTRSPSSGRGGLRVPRNRKLSSDGPVRHSHVLRRTPLGRSHIDRLRMSAISTKIRPATTRRCASGCPPPSSASTPSTSSGSPTTLNLVPRREWNRQGRSKTRSSRWLMGTRWALVTAPERQSERHGACSAPAAHTRDTNEAESRSDRLRTWTRSRALKVRASPARSR